MKEQDRLGKVLTACAEYTQRFNGGDIEITRDSKHGHLLVDCFSFRRRKKFFGGESIVKKSEGRVVVDRGRLYAICGSRDFANYIDPIKGKVKLCGGEYIDFDLLDELAEREK